MSDHAGVDALKPRGCCAWHIPRHSQLQCQYQRVFILPISFFAMFHLAQCCLIFFFPARTAVFKNGHLKLKTGEQGKIVLNRGLDPAVKLETLEIEVRDEDGDMVTSAFPISLAPGYSVKFKGFFYLILRGTSTGMH